MYSAEERRRRKTAVKHANAAIAVFIAGLVVIFLADHFRLYDYDHWKDFLNFFLLPVSFIVSIQLSIRSLSVIRTKRAIGLLAVMLIFFLLAIVFYLLFRNICVIC